MNLDDALVVLRQGGILAYPTEAVWGLGCDPFNQTAVEQLLTLKSRPVEKGLIVVAASVNQIEPLWRELPLSVQKAVSATWPGPNTWLLPDPNHWVPEWVKGEHASVAVRISAHPSVQGLCEAFGGPLISTSANPAAEEPARSLDQLRSYFPELGYLDGVLGDLDQPTTIRDAVSGRVLR